MDPAMRGLVDGGMLGTAAGAAVFRWGKTRQTGRGLLMVANSPDRTRANEDFVALGATTLPGGKLCNLSNN